MRIGSAIENEGGFSVTKGFRGWDVDKEGGPAVIRDTCETCGPLLRAAVTKCAEEIVAKNFTRVAELKVKNQGWLEAEERSLKEKAEFERAWRAEQARKGR